MTWERTLSRRGKTRGMSNRASKRLLARAARRELLQDLQAALAFVVFHHLPRRLVAVGSRHKRLKACLGMTVRERVGVA